MYTPHGHSHDDDIDNWVGDFLESPDFAALESSAKGRASDLLSTFLHAACRKRSRCPHDIEALDVTAGLLEGVAPLGLAADVRGGALELVGTFLESLERVGRLADGRVLGLHAKALRAPFEDAASGKPRPIVAPAATVGRNDPCPCGSGKKYKKCCQGLLG